MSGAKITIHAGTENSAIVNFRDGNGQVIDFTNATRFVAEHFAKDTSKNFTVDNNIDIGTISGDSEGNITFSYANLEITEGEYLIRLTVFDPGHPNTGQQLANECCGPYLTMKICGTVVPQVAAGLYYESEIINNNTGGNFVFGVTNTSEGPNPSGTKEVEGFWGIDGDVGGNAIIIDNGTQTGNTFFEEESIIRVAVNSSGEMWLGIVPPGQATTWLGNGDPAAGTDPTFSDVKGTIRAYMCIQNEGS